MFVRSVAKKSVFAAYIESNCFQYLRMTAFELHLTTVDFGFVMLFLQFGHHPVTLFNAVTDEPLLYISFFCLFFLHPYFVQHHLFYEFL